MPSKLVFPGGMVQDADHSGDWNALFEKVMGRPLLDMIHQPLFNFSDALLNSWTLPPDVAYRICAIRETFEESGLLLATNRELLLFSDEPLVVSSSSAELRKAADQRQKVEQKPEHFLQMCKDLDVVPNIWALHDWRNWLTPVFYKVSEPPAKPKRFNTMFYMCCIDCDNIPDTSADGAETTHAKWKTSDSFLEDDLNRDEGQPPLAPPQVYEMYNLRSFHSLEDLLTECKKRQKVEAKCWMPVYRLCRDAVLLLLPGDYMYPAEPDYEGTKDVPPPMLSSSVDELTDASRSLNRIVFSSHTTVRSLLQVDSTVQDTACTDKLLQKGTVICNI